MGLKNRALAVTDDFPIRHSGDVHNGKVRSVYWLTPGDSKRIISEKGFPVNPESGLAVMVISDRISAFECNWKGKDELDGVPGKGAALNAISEHWFSRFDEAGLGGNHILEVPHPLVWIVQEAKPVMLEAIARQYITGSMWRAYEKGGRDFCGITLPCGLEKNQRLSNLLITPSTKGIMRGIPGIPEDDDVNVTKSQIMDNHEAFGFNCQEDVARYELLLRQGCALAEKELAKVGQILVDTKFELGYVLGRDGKSTELIYIDEVLTPDSSRFWDAGAYANGRIVEKSKEGFRQFLLEKSGLEADVLLNKARMDERVTMAEKYRVPVSEIGKVEDTYRKIAKKITGRDIPAVVDARDGILDALASYGIVN